MVVNSLTMADLSTMSVAFLGLGLELVLEPQRRHQRLPVRHTVLNARRERQDKRARVAQTVVETGEPLQLVDQLLDVENVTVLLRLGQAVMVLQRRRSLEQQVGVLGAPLENERRIREGNMATREHQRRRSHERERRTRARASARKARRTAPLGTEAGNEN